MEKKDIESREDIHKLVDSFYAEVRQDDVIAYLFNEVAQLNWNLHLPKIYSFWDSMLLGAASYKGNPMIKHLELHQKEKLSEKHFDRWIELWEKHVDTLFEGETAKLAKARARSIKDLMMFKIGLLDA